MLYNLKQDPFEKHHQWESLEVAVRLGVAWGGQVQDALAVHFKYIADFPPRQKEEVSNPEKINNRLFKH